MKLIFFSDLHVHEWTEFSNRGDRLRDCVSVLSEIRDYCVRNHREHVFFGGDLFHKRGVLFTSAFQMVVRELVQFKNEGITFWAIDGNHDQEDREGKYNAIAPLMDAGLVKGIDPAQGWCTVYLPEANVCLFSYCDDIGEFKRRVKAAIKSVEHYEVPTIGLFHHGFKGARVGTSLEYEVKEPIDAGKLKLQDLFDFVLCGHYHTHQKIIGINNGWYIGSPLEHTRCDYTHHDQRFKGFIELDTDEMIWSQHKLKRPRFVKVRDDEEIKASQVKGNFVDVLFTDAEHADELKVTILAHGARGVKLVPLPAAKDDAKKRLDIDASLEPKRVLKRYARYKKDDIVELGLDRKELVQVGLELLQEE